MQYQDFELKISTNGNESDFIAKVRSPQGEAQQPFNLPDAVTLENLILRMRGFSRSTRAANCPEVQAASRFGELLFENAFGGEISNLLKSCLDQTSNEIGLRIKLILQDAPELSALPWEFLYLPKKRDFLAHSPATPIVRYLQQATAIRPLAVTLPLKLLVVIASPADFPLLDTAKERRELEKALAELAQEGALHITWIEHATVKNLAEALKKQPFHLLHFIGHSHFDARNSEGALVLENEQGRGDYYEAMRLKALLHNHCTLRLVVLNSCDGGRQDGSDPFSSIAATLMLAGIPAVIAMQFEISDVAAISFATNFYTCLAKGMAIDEAVGEARLYLFAVEKNNVEWGTPVLYLRAKNGELFSLAAKVPDLEFSGFKNQEDLNSESAALEITAKNYIEGNVSGGNIAGKDITSVGEDAVAGDKIVNIIHNHYAEEEKPIPEQIILPKSEPAKIGRFKNWKKYLLWLMVFVMLISVAVFLVDFHKKHKTPVVAEPETTATVAALTTPEKLPFEPEMVQLPDGSWMGKYEVTISEYMECAYAGGCRNPSWLEEGGEYNINTGSHKDYYSIAGMILENKRYPITGVSWDDTQKYIAWLNEKTGKTYRLPTEQKWFTACQAGRTTEYCGGENLDLVAWYDGNSDNTTHEVGQKAANAWDLYDMSGNVWEWTSSFYDAEKTLRAVRGGSWDDEPQYLRSAKRNNSTPDNRDILLGFRLSRM